MREDLTPAVTEDGRIIWLDANGDRDFSPRTQRRIRIVLSVVLAIFVIAMLGIATGIIPPTPWSAMGNA